MVVYVEEKTYRELRGTVKMHEGQPVENALVEIFDKPEYLLDHSIVSANNRPKQRRLATCVASADGKFCFPNIGNGKYELRSSSGSGVNVTHVYVVIDKQTGEKKDLSVEMTLGT
ncbi:MAG: carboxypeptidase-like regulatory domain-containing protein [Candidatus Acidiferrum sp.]